MPDSDLHRDVKELTVQIARVVTQLELWTPILDRQSAGLVNQENRISRMEDRIEAASKQRDEDRQEARQELDDRSKRMTWWLSAAGIGLTLLLHFWK